MLKRQLSKSIVYFGHRVELRCDGRCDKAWGTNGRPQVFFDDLGREIASSEWVTKDGPEPDKKAEKHGIVGYDHHFWVNGHSVMRGDSKSLDYDDYAFLSDNELGTAPEDPGTYEGGHAKPNMAEVNRNPELMNKWCARECERSWMTDTWPEEREKNFDQRVFNDPTTALKVQQRGLIAIAGVDMDTIRWDEKAKTFIKE